ncbi:hypothetical protein L208DRAFT_1382128 [Tricholoma matsutake]|nr:hypothetical protein L208DRAFT_1382128 [Tricholoma matsutake 945]
MKCLAHPMTRNQYVPSPTFSEGVATDGLMAPSNTRGEKKCLNDMERQMRLRVEAFKKYADCFLVPMTIADLQSVRMSKEVKLQLDQYCLETLEPQPHSRPFSAMYYDPSKTLLFCYMGNCWKDGSVENPSMQPLDSQYKDRTLTDLERGIEEGKKVVHDGLHGDALKLYHEATQILCSCVHPKFEKDQRYNMKPKELLNPRLMHYQIQSNQASGTSEAEEQKGVLHLVQGWIQQKQPEKIFHKVAKWNPHMYKPGDDVTPGCIGFEVLQTKQPGWGAGTDYGQWAKFFKSRVQFSLHAYKAFTPKQESGLTSKFVIP